MKGNNIVIGIILVVGLLSPKVCCPEENTWPNIAPFEASIYFPDASKADAWFKILGIDGDPVYILQCYSWRNANDPDFDYSGDFECRLKSLYTKDFYSTLLTDNPKQSRDWDSRARILAEELVGDCANYPEYGRVRHFHLRRMEITFIFDNIGIQDFQSPNNRKLKRREFKFFRFTIRVKPDPNAYSQIAEPVPFLRPPFAHPEDPADLSLKCGEILRIR